MVSSSTSIALFFTFKYSIYLEVISAYGVRQRSYLNFFTCLDTISCIIHHFPTDSSYTNRNTDAFMCLCVQAVPFGSSPISSWCPCSLVNHSRLSGALLPRNSCLSHSVSSLWSRSRSCATLKQSCYFVICGYGVSYGYRHYWNKHHRNIWGSWDQVARPQRMGAAVHRGGLTSWVNSSLWNLTSCGHLQHLSPPLEVTPPSEWRSPFPCISGLVSVTSALVVLTGLQAHWLLLPWV